MAEAAEERDPEAKTATAEDLEAAVEAAVEAVDDLVDGFGEASNNVREALLVGARGEAQAEVLDAQESVADARKAFDAGATASQKRLAKQYEMRAAELEAAKDARDGLRDDAETAAAAFATAQNAREGVTMEPIEFPEDWAFATPPVIAIQVESEEGTEDITLAQFEEFTDGTEGGRVVITSDGLGVAGLQDLVNAINSALAANDIVNEARDERNEVRDELLALDTVGELYNQVIGAEENLDAAEVALSALDAAVADYRELVELNSQYGALDDAVTEAREAITNEVDGDPAGLGVTSLEGDESFTINDDVYIFDEAQTLDDFGAIGIDKIYFGEGYTLVALGDQDIEGNVGDISALEIFWIESASGVELYVETETFGGNASGTEDLVQLTLTGVQGVDITDELVSGYLSAGAVA